MAIGLSPIGNSAQMMDNNGSLLAGGMLYFYVAGSSSVSQAIYSDAISTPAANPVVLSSSGRVPKEVWLDTSLSYNVVLTQADGVTVIQNWDNITAIQPTGGSALNYSEWVTVNAIPFYINATQFSTSANLGTTFQVGRRIQATVSAGIIYGTISTVSYVTATTVTVVWDSGSLDAGLSSVAVGILSVTNQSLPAYVGTWTPAFALSTPGTSTFTYDAQVGYYTKAGRTVTCWGRIGVNVFTIGTGSGLLNLTGFPYTPAYQASGVVSFAGAFVTNGPTAIGMTPPATYAQLFSAGSTGANYITLGATNLNSTPHGANMNFSITYFTN